MFFENQYIFFFKKMENQHKQYFYKKKAQFDKIFSWKMRFFRNYDLKKKKQNHSQEVLYFIQIIKMNRYKFQGEEREKKRKLEKIIDNERRTEWVSVLLKRCSLSFQHSSSSNFLFGKKYPEIPLPCQLLRSLC